jgi:pimeloyl-ACP methyl ester carboxylesterase
MSNFSEQAATSTRAISAQQSYHVTIPGTSGAALLSVVSFEAVEALGEPYRITIQLTHPQELARANYLSKEASFSIAAGLHEPRMFAGCITHFNKRKQTHDFHSYEFVIEPLVARLRLTHASRIYQKKTAPQIIESILRKHDFNGNQFQFKTRRSYPEHAFRMQYQLSDWDYIHLLMQQEGLYSYFTPGKFGDIIVFGDDIDHYIYKPELTVPYRETAGLVCQNVILVTHSMGGLVARYCTEILLRELKQQDKVLGVVHGVMPTTGAATAYKRVKAGTEGMTGIALGADAADMTAVFAQAPGPLQLLPSAEYGNGWLKIKDGTHTESLPAQKDPYSEIYTVRGKWWGLINDKLINPFDEKKQTLDKDWKAFEKLINKPVRKFHGEIAHRYHPNTYAFYGDDKAHSTWGDVVWERKSLPTLVPEKSFTSLDNTKESALYFDSGTGHIELRGKSAGRLVQANFDIKEALENGDGTVPVRSGKASQGKVRVCIGYPGVDHEGAYKNEAQRLFTLWSIVKIAQHVKPPLRYEIDGACPT